MGSHNRNLPAVLGANFCVCSALYMISPLLPIYLVESVRNGGLAWSKAEAFGVCGTFLSIVYVTPLLSGVIRDAWLGVRRTEWLGYGLACIGISSIAWVEQSAAMLLALTSVAFGFGSIRVGLAATLGRLPQMRRMRGYDFYHNTSCVGFIVGALISPFLFFRYGIVGNVCCSLVALGVSGLMVRMITLEEQEELQPSLFILNWTSAQPFWWMLAITLPFFVCFNQLLTSFPVYIHQSLDRTVAGFEIPALWLSAGGSLVMTGFSPFVRWWWHRKELSEVCRAILKVRTGYMLGTGGFAFLACLSWSSSQQSSIMMLLGFFVGQILCSCADFHIRPTLLAVATHAFSPRYHAMATGIVFSGIGLGAKLAGVLASYMDVMGFYGICMLCGICCGFLGLITMGIQRYGSVAEIPSSPNSVREAV